MTAWGVTGRVTLDGGDVEVDDVWIGYAKPGYAEAYSLSRGKAWTTNAALTLDAAVMWVLQHASWSDRERTKAIRDVWRAERPVVAKVYQKKWRGRLTEWRGDLLVSGGEYLLSHVGALGEFQHILDSADASARAEYARAEYARQVPQ